MSLPVEVVEGLRASLREGLAGQGMIPPYALDELVDLAVHAATQALSTMQRIALHTSPDPRIGIAALGPALSILHGLVENQLAGLKAFAAENSLPVGECKVQFGGSR